MGDRTDILSLKSAADGAASPKSALFGSKSHMSTMKSLSLLHELQDYIHTLENIATSKTLELESLKSEKKSVEKVLLGKVKDLQRNDGAVFSQQLSDLPPRLRALLEDNRMLKDKLRKYKSSTNSYERELKQLQQKNRALEDLVQKLQQQLKACSVQPEDLTREDELAQELRAKQHVIQNLEYRVKVLQQKQETDSRMFKQTLAERNREKDTLLQQIDAVKHQLDDKDKEMREKVLEVKKLQRRLAPQRRQADGLAPAFYHEAAGFAATPHQQHHQGSSKQQEHGGAGAGDSHAPETEVKVVLCVIRDEPPPPPDWSKYDSFFLTQMSPSAVNAGQSSSRSCAEEQAAVKIQASFRGHATRKQLQAERERQEKAAVIIQAHARGMATRHQMKKQQNDPTSQQSDVHPRHPASSAAAAAAGGNAEDAAAAKIQAYARGAKARGEVERVKAERVMAASRTNQGASLKTTVATSQLQQKSSKRISGSFTAPPPRGH